MEHFLSVKELQALPLGTRVAFPEGADAYPDFLFTERLTGTVVEQDYDCAWVKLDEHKDELNEWDNQIQVWFWEQSDDELPSQRVERLYSTQDDTLSDFVVGYCMPRKIEVNGDVFGLVFDGGGQTEYTATKSILIIEDAARIYGLRR